MLVILNGITLPFIGEIDLTGSVLIVFFICLLACVAFEFVNGFHDTANAVATVIYTKALKPHYAVPWSGLWNFLGVFTGGVAVAMGILKLVPLNEIMALPVKVGACLVLAVLFSSIIWNLGTWYLGIPCSSSHTMIGSMIGGGLLFTFYYGGSGVNWDKAKEIGASLILSPLFGFGVAYLLMWFIINVVKSKKLLHVPQGEKDKPPILIRLLLITTCTLVSFFHGSNDGQKGVGLLMLILIAFLPAKYAMDHSIGNDKILASLTKADQSVQNTIASNPGASADALSLDSLIKGATQTLQADPPTSTIVAGKVFKSRKQMQAITKGLKAIVESKTLQVDDSDRANLKSAATDLNKITEYAPVWVIALISISLGVGTMIGWKRIVVTIGERIGKEHLNYAQGASAELVAAGTIGLSTGFGLPVSTTHVLSSGVAGAMVATNGAKNLNTATLKNIAMAWILTLPVTIILAGLLFVIFHLFI
jgi:inorganic phosphate transporter, PiT family